MESALSSPSANVFHKVIQQLVLAAVVQNDGWKRVGPREQLQDLINGNIGQSLADECEFHVPSICSVSSGASRNSKACIVGVSVVDDPSRPPQPLPLTHKQAKQLPEIMNPNKT